MNRRAPVADSRPLEWAGFMLLALFGIWSLLAMLPLQLLSPVWGHQLVTTLVNNSPLLLIGVAFMRLALNLDPGESAWQSWRLRVCRLAALVAVLYLLLIPFDLFTTWRQVESLQRLSQGRLRAIDQRYGEALQVIERATDASSLASGLRQFQGPPLSPQDLARPLVELKRDLRASLLSSRTSLRNQAAGPTPATLFAMGREALRLMFSSLVCALGLSALSWNPTTQRSQLQALTSAQHWGRHRAEANPLADLYSPNDREDGRPS